MCLAATEGGGVGVGGGIDPTNSQPGHCRNVDGQHHAPVDLLPGKPGTHGIGGWLYLGSCLGGTVKNITGRTFSKQQTKGPSISYVAHISISKKINASLQLQECYLVLPTLL
jgi:hypothetical protein